MCNDFARRLFTKEEQKKRRKKGFLPVALFAGVMGIIVFGFIAMMLGPVFSNLGPSFDSTLQLFIIALIPFMGLAMFWGIKTSLGR